jgi:hypothetical protein
LLSCTKSGSFADFTSAIAWTKNTYTVDIPWFNDRVDTLNTFVRNYFKEDRVEGVQFWRHSGFWSPENQELVYTDDEVHFNEVNGYKK